MRVLFNFFNGLPKALQKTERQVDSAFFRARQKADVIFLTWANDGSPQNPVKPPILTGILRGSSSAFTDDVLTSSFNQTIRSLDDFGGKKTPPTTNEQSKKNTSVFVWNTPYAHRQHEEFKTPGGPYSEQDGSVGKKWLENHLKSDKEMYIKLIAEFAREMSDNAQPKV